MSSLATPELRPISSARIQRERLNRTDRRANSTLKWLAFGAGVLIFIAMVAVAWQVVDGATGAYDKFGLSFLGHVTWNPSLSQFGGLSFIYGTMITSVMSVVLATFLGVAIGLFLALMAPRQVAIIVGPLVEMLAAIPSVVLGLIGIFLICPFVEHPVEPILHSVLGWIPLFGTPQSPGNSMFAATLVLTIMVVPIIAALTRDMFATVPRELRDGAEALGSTRWEMIRGVVLPTTSSGIVAACVLGFGRAVGEAIAVSQVIGAQAQIAVNTFKGGNTLASAIALQATNPVSDLHKSSLFYLAAVLFVLGLITNLGAQWISRHFNRL